MRINVKKIFQFCLIVILIFLCLEVSFRFFLALKYNDKRYLTLGINNPLKFDMDYYNGYRKLKKPIRSEDKIFLGFRTAAFNPNKPDNKYRVVAMGGSSTYGIFDTYERSWPYLLEQSLGEGYEVINTGLPGHATYGVVNLLKNEVIGWSPDVVIVYSLYNHVNFDNPDVRPGVPSKIFRIAKTLFYDKSVVLMTIMHKLSLKDKRQNYRRYLEEIVDVCKESNSRVIFVKQLVNPITFDEDLYQDLLVIIEEFDQRDNCYIVDFSRYGDDWENISWRTNDEVHLSCYGKTLLSSILKQKILELNNR